jgi:hypothetical protein
VSQLMLDQQTSAPSHQTVSSTPLWFQLNLIDPLEFMNKLRTVQSDLHRDVGCHSGVHGIWIIIWLR